MRNLLSVGLGTPKRRVFFSFDYDADIWRVNQVRNMGLVENKQDFSPNKLEEIRRSTDSAVKKWIDESMKPCSCVIVLVGSKTARSKWVKYEIAQAARMKKGLFGVHIHDLKNQDGDTSNRGINPLPSKYDCYNYSTSLTSLAYFGRDNPAYHWIKSHLSDWVEEAIEESNEPSFFGL